MTEEHKARIRELLGGQEIWTKLNEAGYMILPTALVQAMIREEAMVLMPPDDDLLH